MPVSTGLEFTKIFSWDGGGLTAPHYTDVTLEAQSPMGTAFTILNTTSHYLYLGHDEKFDMAVFDIDVGAGLGELTWQYFSTTWTTFIPGSGRLTHDPDVGDIGNINAAFSGTATDLVEKAAAASSKGFSIAMAVALGQRIRKNAINKNWNTGH